MSFLEEANWKELFADRHIGITKHEQQRMLAYLGFDSRESLVSVAVPDSIKRESELKIGAALSETEATQELQKIAKLNVVFKSWIGMGYANTHTPAVIRRNILENPGWYTQYTPYQPEIAQGRLESLLNFQTMVSELTGLPIANASLLDEATAAAEAMAMSHGIKNRDGSRAFFVSDQCHPQTIEVVRGRAQALGISLLVGNHHQFEFKTAIFGSLLSYPNTQGVIEDFRDFASKTQAQGGLVTIVADILALVLLQSPGELGADIVVGNTQRFGVPLGYGGPHAAYFATREEYKRKVPGRIVGVSKDQDGRVAYRLALQTREQHIRREKATSNICTAQALLANMAAMYAVYHGREGLQKIANRVHSLTVICANGLGELGFKVEGQDFFDTVTVNLSVVECESILVRATAKKINFRAFVGEGKLGISLDETTTPGDVEDIWSVFSKSANCSLEFKNIAEASSSKIPVKLKRTDKILQHPTFKRYRSETELMRYIKRLEQRDLSLTNSMIPLGSCTMKLNAASELLPISWPEFNQIHPFVPKEQATGYRALCIELEAMLADVTGFDAVSLQPNSGAQGEYAGLLVIKAYHQGRGDGHRKVCLIPRSAHGTNPASAQLAGLSVVSIACDTNGNIDLEDLKMKSMSHAENLAAIMVTYPSTHGVFEERIVEVCEIIHAHGGQVYLDGANLNAQLGLCSPGNFGADVCHLNLHKTFAIPHGGGGPGVGPIAVKSHLADYLPSHPIAECGGSSGIAPISAAPFGSAGILPIPWMYMKMLGAEGLKKSTEIAILSANYIAKRLSSHFDILFTGESGLVAHECIVDLRPFKSSCGLEVVDVAKRLIDYSFHSPTMAFPVPGTLMIEPTESESLHEIDRFCDAMISIRREIEELDKQTYDRSLSPLKQAPHTSQLLESAWDRPYSQQTAFYPSKGLLEYKFWPYVGRIDEAYGDRNFACTCGSVDEYED